MRPSQPRPRLPTPAHSQQSNPHDPPHGVLAPIPASLAREGPMGTPRLCAAPGWTGHLPALCLASAIPGLPVTRWAPGKLLPQGLCTGRDHSLARPSTALLPDAVWLPPLLQAFMPSASSHRGRPRQPAAFAGWPLRGAVAVHSMLPPVRSGRLSSPHWKERAQPRAGARSSCCPWVTHMVGSQLAEAGPSV